MKFTNKSATSFQPKLDIRLKVASITIAAFLSPLALANPVGPTVVNGAATVVNNGNTLTVTNTPGAILNWQQFNIGQGQLTQFNQQSAQSSVLNRVVGPDSSQILGTLRSNGRVFLINPNGIMFGAGSVLDVNGLIASTLNITNTDFLLNRMNFNGNSGTGVVNQGTITTPFGGSVYLIGNNVTNEGVITTPQGQVVLAAGNSVSMVNTVTPHVSVTVTAGGEAINLGQVNAQGGSINIYGALVQQQGIVSANSVGVDAQGNIVLSATQSVNLAQGSSTTANGTKGGNITIQSGATGNTTVAGTVEATGSNGTGGSIQVLGNTVALTDTARLDASGTTGGGSILVGGDYQGKNAAVQNAFTTHIAHGATLRADATLNGNGGKIIAWSDDTTSAYGSFSARGGALSGNGGLIETSGHYLDVAGIRIDAAALNGTAGTWLLDPVGMYIYGGTNNGLLSGASISDGTINAVLDAGTSVTLASTTFIDFSGASTIGKNTSTGGTGVTFTLNAATDIVTNPLALISGANPLNVTMNAGGAVHLSGMIDTRGGNFTLTAGGVASIDSGGATLPTFYSASWATGKPAGLYTNGGSVNITATDFRLGGDQSLGTFFASAIDSGTVGTTNWTGTPTGWVADGSLGGNITINPASGASGTGVRIGVNSLVGSGSGTITMYGHNYQNDNTTWPLASGNNYSVGSRTGINMIFDQMSHVKSLNAHNYGHLGFAPLTFSTVLITTNLADPRCATALCIGGPGTGQRAYSNSVAVVSQGDIIVDTSGMHARLNEIALVALHDIILNGAINIAPVWESTGLPITDVGTNLALVAGNDIINNVGATAITQQPGHGWVMFARDSTTSKMNGLTAPTVINLGQDTALLTSTNILAAVTTTNSQNWASSPYYNQALDLALATGSALFNATVNSGGNAQVFWGASVPATTTVQEQATNNCLINPALCGDTMISPIENRPIIKAVGDITYVADTKNMGSRELKKEADKADKEAEEAEDQEKKAKTPKEKDKARKHAEKKRAEADSLRAEAKIREADKEARAAEAEVKAAKTPEEKSRAEMRKTIAESRLAKEKAKKAEDEARHAEGPAKREAEIKKAEAAIKSAEADAIKAETEVKQAQSEAQKSGSTEAKATVETKQAEANVAKSEIEVKQAEAAVNSAKTPEEKAKAQEKLAAAEVNKAKAEAKQAEVEAKQAEDKAKESGSPVDKLVAENKKADEAAKKADVEVKAAKAEAAAAKTPEEQKRTEEKVAKAETQKAEKETEKAAKEVKVAEERAKASDNKEAKKEVEDKKAEHDVKKADAKVKKAEEDAHKEKGSNKQKDAERKVAEVKAEKAEAEAKQADHEAKQAKEESKSSQSADRKYAALKKAEASELKAQAKRKEAEAKRAEAEYGPDSSQARQKRNEADALNKEASSKESEFKDVKQRVEDKAILAFGSVDVAANKNRVKDVMAARHEFKIEALKPALNILKADPKAADLKACGPGSGDVCIRPPSAAIANALIEVMPRVRVPVMTPVTSFLPAIQRKVAVVIGINAYQDPSIPSLNGAANDADGVGKMLKDKMGYDVLMVRNGSRADIVRALNKVSDETGSRDSVMVYYAGHGYQTEDTKAGYWIPSDGSSKDPSKWISNADISRLLTNIPAKQMMLVSDSCFSGTLASEQKAAPGTMGKNVQEILGKRSVIVMSSGGEEPVLDEGKDGHSVFSWHLMDKIGKVEQYKNGIEVFDAVRDDVAKDGIPQVPLYGASVSAGHMAGGEYLFEVRKY